MELSRRRSGWLAVAAGAAFVLAACSDDPVGPPPNGNDDHPDASGVQVTFLGEEIFTYMDGGDIPSIDLPPNSDFGDVQITFLDEQGDPIELEDDDVFIELVIGDEDVLSWTLAAGPSTTAPHFSVNLSTGDVGETTVRLELWHDDHIEWDTPDVAVNVQIPDNGENGENNNEG